MRRAARLLAIAIVMLGAFTVHGQDLALDSMSHEQLVAARQEAMKRNGMALRGAEVLTGADAVAAATVLVEMFEQMPAYFRKGSITPQSKALPRIWTSDSQFEDFTGEALIVARAMLQAAETADTRFYQDAVRAMGNTCTECHDVFRAER